MTPVDTLFVIVATALVLLMTPALALFYGGTGRSVQLMPSGLVITALLSVPLADTATNCFCPAGPS
jgi:ammonia channel protein AmtB